ncbi:MAG: ATP-binding protein [Hydrococcus sp. Prado102]|jgi:signal transduction histidine kinase|nr:ATP-binding protein [Hydrococcus sp. Prado102]
MVRFMQVKFLRNAIANKFKQLPLRVILTVPLVIQIIVTTGLVGYLSYKNGQHAVNNLTGQLIRKASNNVNRQLNTYLALPHQINQLNIDAIESKRIDLQDSEALGRYFWQQLQIFDVSYINYASVEGEFVGAGRWLDPQKVTISIRNPKIDRKTYVWTTNNRGDRTKKIATYDNFQPNREAWYIDALKVGKPTWTRIYNWDGTPEFISIAGSRPIYDKQGKIVGVLGVDLLLTNISDFLRQLTISPSGKVFILDRDGLIVASSSSESPFIMVGNEAKRLNATNSSDPLIQATTKYLIQKFKNFKAITESQQVDFKINGDRNLVRVSPWQDKYGLDWLVVVVVPEKDFMAQIDANTDFTIILCSIALLASIAIGIAIARWVTHPILRLNQAAKEFACGNFDQTLEVSPYNELGELTNSFNQMVVQVQTSFNELRSLNQALSESETKLALQNHTLEERVEQRTAELSQALEQLQAAQDELISATQQQLLQSDKMASLGELMAGVAHEINNPLGAIQASSSNIRSALAQVKQQLLQLLQTLSPERLIDFFVLVEKVEQRKDPLSFRQERQLKRTLKQVLENKGIENAEILADSLSQMGISSEIDTWMTLLKLPDNIAIVESAHNLSAIQNNSHNIGLAAERAAKIVSALKNYVRQTSPETMVKASVTDGIDTVLTIYQNQLKVGVEVTKVYESIPAIFCYPEELIQIWSNLIHNAIQAMNRQGSLNIAVFESDNSVVVEITDSGSGIPPDIQQKIFDPFFTTKPVGEGSGLGLDIVRKIVEKHQGKIEVTSQPGHTTFRVGLPIQ